MLSGFCYTRDTSCGVTWYRPLLLATHCDNTECTNAEFLPSGDGAGMLCNFGGTCDDVNYTNTALAFCCDFD